MNKYCSYTCSCYNSFQSDEYKITQIPDFMEIGGQRGATGAYAPPVEISVSAGRRYNVIKEEKAKRNEREKYSACTK